MLPQGKLAAVPGRGGGRDKEDRRVQGSSAGSQVRYELTARYVSDVGEWWGGGGGYTEVGVVLALVKRTVNCSAGLFSVRSDWCRCRVWL